MSKFKVKLKLQGLELEIEGSRDDMHLIGQNLGQQMAGLLQPAGAIVEGQALQQPFANKPEAILEAPKKVRRRRQGVQSNPEGTEGVVVDWQT